MKTKSNLILGELYYIMNHFAPPVERRYGKDFYERKFFIKLGRSLQDKLPFYDIKTSETDTEYILRIDKK